MALGGEQAPWPDHPGTSLVPPERVVVEQDFPPLGDGGLEGPEHIRRGRPELDLELVVPARPQDRLQFGHGAG